VPLGNAPDIGWAEAPIQTWATPPMWKRPREDILTSAAPCNPSASRWSPRLLLASSAAVLWRGAEAVGVADAMIEADKVFHKD
jgi:hypothetical protein